MPSVSNTVDRRRSLPTAAFTLITVWVLLLVAVGGFRFVAWPRPTWQTWILGIMPTPEVILLFGILLLIGSAET
jgi:nitrate reductase NapE component